jgi:hypothetical protein
MPLLSQTLADAVERDGLPRVVTADDQTVHVLYLDGEQVRSMLASAWPPPLPSDPTPAEIAAATLAKDAQAAQNKADVIALRQAVISTAQSTVGLSIDALNNLQVRSLLACLLHKADALDKDLKVRPLGKWL